MLVMMRRRRCGGRNSGSVSGPANRRRYRSGGHSRIIACSDSRTDEDKYRCRRNFPFRVSTRLGSNVNNPAPGRLEIGQSAIVLRLERSPGALTDLVHAIREFRKLADKSLTLQGSEYARAVQELNKAIDKAEGLLQ